MKPHPTIEKACALLRVHWPTCKDWTEDQLLNWIGFFNRLRQCAVVMDGEECVGFGAVRFLNHEGESVDVFMSDPNGRIAWVEMVVATNPAALMQLMGALLACIGSVGAPVELLGGQDIKTRKVRLYPLGRYASLVLGMAKAKD